MAAELGEKRPGDEPFESETEMPDHGEGGKGIFGTPHTALWATYCEDDLRGMVVRGINFASDKKKIDCGPPLYKLMHADLFKTRKEEERCAHFAARKESWANQRWERQQAAKAAGAAAESAGSGAAPAASSQRPLPLTAQLADDPVCPLLIINFLIPGSGFNMNLVLYYARRIKPAEQLRKEKAARAAHPHAGKKVKSPQPGQNASAYSIAEWESDDFPHDLERIAAFDGLMQKFLDGDDEFRDCRLKIVPRIAEGSWVVKKSIGRVPAILGKKVKQFYYRSKERNYLEIDADLGTSMVAGRIIQMVKGTCKGLVVDLSFLLQGESKDELPESLIGGVRMIHADLDKITWLEENYAKNKPEFDF